MAEHDFSKPIVYRVDGMHDVRVQRDVVYKRDGRLYYRATDMEPWEQDAHDAHLIALDVRSLIDTKQAA